MKGEIVRWNDDRGFGFISSSETKGDVFAHISKFRKGYSRPKVGDRVQFQIEVEKRKQNAKSISIDGLNPLTKEAASLSSTLFSGLLLIVIAFVIYAFVTKPKSNPAYETMVFSCQGKTYCSEMKSCNEAKFYLTHCPNVRIDGNNDGEPCERQLCNGW